MSAALAKTAREAMKAKAHRLAEPHSGRVDSSTWTPSEPLNAEAKTGMRPVSKQHLKSGGDVVAARSDRKPRKAGGRVNEFENRNDKDANEDREGVKHVGGLKKGGKVAKAGGGGVSPAGFSTSNPGGTRPTGGRIARATGGRAKHKAGTNVNIVIAPPKAPGALPGAAPMIPPPPAPLPGSGAPMPGGAAMMPHPAGMPGGGAPMPMPMPMPPQGMQMGRKAGGRVYRSYKDMDAGSLGGLGRLEKTEIEKHKGRKG